MSAFMTRLPTNSGGFARLCLGMTLLFSAFSEIQWTMPSQVLASSNGRFGYEAMAAFYGWQVRRRSVKLVCLANSLCVLGQLCSPVHHPTRGSQQNVLLMGVTACGSYVVAQSLLAERDLNIDDKIMLWFITLSTGLLQGVVWPAQGYLLTHYAPAQLLDWYAAIFSLCFFANSFLGPALVSFVLRQFGREAPAYVLLAVLGVLSMVALPEPGDTQTGAGDAETGETKKPSWRASKWIFYKDPSAPRLCALGLGEGLCLNALGSAVFPLLAQWGLVKRDPGDLIFEERLQLVMLLTGLGHMLAALVYAPLAQKFGRRPILVLQAFLLVLAAILILAHQAFLKAGSSLASPVCACAGSLLLGVGVILTRTGNTTLVSYRYPDCSGSAFAMMAAVRRYTLNFHGAAKAWTSMASSLFLALASLVAALHQPLFLRFSDQEETSNEEEKCGPLRISLLSNKIEFVQVLLPLLRNHDLQVVSPAPAVQDLCVEAGIPLKHFPTCSDGFRFASICKQNAEYREAVERVYEELRQEKPDILLTAGFYVLPNHAISIPSMAAWNFHPSALPRYRGGLPLQAHILRGEKEMAVTLHRLTEIIDDPSTIVATIAPISLSDSTTTQDLLDASAVHLPDLVEKAIATLPGGQGAVLGKVDSAPVLLVEDDIPHGFGVKLETRMIAGEQKKSNSGVFARTRIDWDQDTATDIERAYRAFFGNFGLFTDYEGLTWEVSLGSGDFCQAWVGHKRRGSKAHFADKVAAP
ncbi:Methionyl-tRNA formyltransferase [Symbiodinium microadriaticum]|uniref:Methionyl-tRNA formyltransferase n=1 Tax=Symbiodinium microadriaticum TaxID=2951 RepID=A0A1Q9EGP5_SYMMI|nr:Methionyl-tRNA formyltransferase [Symbiodinium microadriaticum]